MNHFLNFFFVKFLNKSLYFKLILILSIFSPFSLYPHGFPVLEESSTRLEGSWFFYPSKLYTGEDINKINVKTSGTKKPILVQIPTEWNEYKLPDSNGSLFERHGYGTFITYLTGLNPGDEYAIRMNYASSAYQIFIGHSVIPQCGVGIVGTSIEDYKPDYKHVVCRFKAVEKEMQIVFQISNFHHISGGFREAPLVGKYKIIMNEYLTLLTYFGLALAFLFGSILKLLLSYFGSGRNTKNLYMIGFTVSLFIFLLNYPLRLGREISELSGFFFQVRSHLAVLPSSIAMLILYANTWESNKKINISIYTIAGILLAFALFYIIAPFLIVVQFFRY